MVRIDVVRGSTSCSTDIVNLKLAQAIYIYKPTRCTKFCVIRLYFPLDALHVSNYISPSSGATFISCTSYLVYAGTIRLAVEWL